MLISRANLLRLDVASDRVPRSTLDVMLEIKKAKFPYVEQYGLATKSVGDYGRFYPRFGGMAYVKRVVRGALLRNFYHDLDCVNSIPNITVQYARAQYKRGLPTLTRYVTDRDAVHATIIRELKLVEKVTEDGLIDSARDQAKTLVNSVMNGKGLKDIKSAWLHALRKEMEEFAETIVAKDPQHAALLADTKANGKSFQSFLSKILQREERKVLVAIDAALTANGRIPSAWIYDGLCVEKAFEGETTIPAEIIAAVVEAVRVATGYTIALKVKPFECYAWLDEELEKWRALSPVERAIGEMTMIGAASPVKEVQVSHPYVSGCLEDEAVHAAVAEMGLTAPEDGVTATKTTLILRSHLGTGKTTEAVKMIREHHRVLVLSARKSFTRFIMGDLAGLKEEGIEFHSYDESFDYTKTLAEQNYLVCQVESLHRLEAEFKDYDFVVVDESETILNQFHSFATHKDNILKNFLMFERIVRGAKRVLFADAFVTGRTLIAAANLRDAATTLYINNTFNPYARTAKLLWAEAKTTGTRVAATAEFGNRIAADLAEGKRIAVVWTSLTAAKNFIKKHVEGKDYKWRLYSSESPRKESAELTAVETHWRDLNLLCYTTAITIGVNYNPVEEEAQFDRLYLYACSRTALPRDIAQALLRCRKIRTNELVYTIDNSPPPRRAYQVDTIRADFLKRRETLTVANPIVMWKESPKWVEDNFVLNERESALRSYVYAEQVQEYLTLSGYTLEEEQVENKADAAEGAEKIQATDVPIIDGYEAAQIRSAMIAGDATPMDRHALRRFNIYKQLRDDIKTPTAENAETVADALWAKVYDDAEAEQVFWNLVNEKHNTPEEYASREAHRRFVEMANTRLLRRVTLAKVLPVLGMTHTCEGKASFELTPEIIAALEPLEAEIYKHFTIKGKVQRKKEFGGSHAAEMLELLFNTWGVETVKSSVLRQRAGKRGLVFSLEITKMPWWDHIVDRHEGVLVVLEDS